MKQLRRLVRLGSVQRPSKPSKTIVSNTEVGGDKTPNGQAAWKNKSKSNNKTSMEFTGAVKSDSVLFQKVEILGIACCEKEESPLML